MFGSFLSGCWCICNGEMYCVLSSYDSWLSMFSLSLGFVYLLLLCLFRKEFCMDVQWVLECLKQCLQKQLEIGILLLLQFIFGNVSMFFNENVVGLLEFIGNRNGVLLEYVWSNGVVKCEESYVEVL